MDQGTLFLFLAAPVLEAGLLDLLMALCLGFLEGPFLCLTLAGLGCGLGLGLLLVVLLAALFQLGHGGREAKADLVEGLRTPWVAGCWESSVQRGSVSVASLLLRSPCSPVMGGTLAISSRGAAGCCTGANSTICEKEPHAR